MIYSSGPQHGGFELYDTGIGTFYKKAKHEAKSFGNIFDSLFSSVKLTHGH